MASPPSQVATELRACLTAIGPSDDVLGGIALLGHTLPGLDLTIDATLMLRRGVLVVVGVDLPDPALRLDAPVDGPWLVDGWRLSRPSGGSGPAGNPVSSNPVGSPRPVGGSPVGSPVGDALGAANAVAARLEAPGAPAVPVRAVIAVGPYAGTIVQAPGDRERGLRVFVPSTRGLLGLAAELGRGVTPATAAAAGELLRVLAPGVTLPHTTFLAEGFA